MHYQLLQAPARKLSAALLAIFLLFIARADAQGNYVVNGSAYSSGPNEWVLTNDMGSQGGSVWYQNYLSLGANFDLKFDVFLGYNDYGADGIAFVLQPNSTGAGSHGGGLGYQGIAPSVTVEYDTYQNDDPWYDHISVQRNGDVNYSGVVAGPVPASAYGDNIEDGQWHTTRITWDAASHTLTVYFDDMVRVVYNSDMVNNTFGSNPNVYWGFTGATGGASNLQMFRVTSAVFTEAPSINISSANVLCHGAASGTATAVFSGGQPPYTFMGWSNGAQTTTITGLTAGTYTATMIDAAGTIANKSVTITEPAALTASVSGGMNCNTGTTATLFVNATGGTAGYMYSVNGGNYGFDPQFTNLAAGAYSFNIMDAAGCVQTVTRTLTNTTPLLLSATPQHATGPGSCNGSVILTPSGGTAPYVFNEFEESFNGNQLDVQKFQFRNGVFNQNNTLTGGSVINYNGWDNTMFTNQTFTRAAGKTFEGSFRQSDPARRGYFMAGWADGNTGNGYTSYASLAHAIYFHSTDYVEIFESGYYMGAFSVPVMNTDWSDYKIVLTDDGASYYIRATGSTSWIHITTTVSYQLNNTLKLGVAYYGYDNYYGGFETDNWKVGGNAPTANLCAGTYTYSVTDAAGCTVSTTVNIQDYVPVTATFSTVNASCYGATDGAIHITASNGTPAYSYSIDNGASYQLSSAFTTLAAGTYTILVKDASGTITVPQPVTIGQPQQVVVSVTASGATSFCPGGSVTLTASGADSYSWSNGSTAVSITVNTSGNYSVSGTANGCSSNEVTTTVTAFPAPTPSISISRNNTTHTGLPANTIALGYGAQNLTLTATAAAGFAWSNGAGTASITVAPLVTTNYSVLVTDANGCTGTAQVTVNVVDVRCGNKNDKVLVCHKTGSASNPYVQVCVAPAAVATHLANGGYLGMCQAASASRSTEMAKPSVIIAETAPALLAFPNPGRGLVNLRMKDFQAGIIQVQVLDGNGKMIRSIRHTLGYAMEDVSLDLTGFAAGTYTLKVSGGNVIRFVKIVIAR